MQGEYNLRGKIILASSKDRAAFRSPSWRRKLSTKFTFAMTTRIDVEAKECEPNIAEQTSCVFTSTCCETGAREPLTHKAKET